MNALNKPVVLVIDPDPLTLTAIAAMLDSAQFKVYCARDKVAAIKGATHLALDLIICDESIDDADGEEVISDLRAIPNRDDVPILYMSHRQLPDIISRNTQAGVAYHIKKPLEPARLMDTIDKALFELPLINSQIKNKLRKPHFPTPTPGPALGSFTIPHITPQY
ncbi:MAG: response regulator [Pirellulaceae bacterium]|nr:response regulator [Pirellulaceae bacterium]